MEIIRRHSKENIHSTFNMAWPSIVESFFTAFAGLVDSLMVSSLGSYAVAAVGLTTQPKFIGPLMTRLRARFFFIPLLFLPVFILARLRFSGYRLVLRLCCS